MRGVVQEAPSDAAKKAWFYSAAAWTLLAADHRSPDFCHGIDAFRFQRLASYKSNDLIRLMIKRGCHLKMQLFGMDGIKGGMNGKNNDKWYCSNFVERAQYCSLGKAILAVSQNEVPKARHSRSKKNGRNLQ